MTLLRTPSMKLVLLLALILPLQGFASGSCKAFSGPAAGHHHCADDAGKAQSGVEQQHHCGTCCVAAIALLPFSWIAPRCARFEASPHFPGSPPEAALDRLDRPPRLV